VFLVLRNVVRIDQDVIQIYDDVDVNHVGKDVVHKPLKSGGCVSKPFRHYQPLKGTVTGDRSGRQSSIHPQRKFILDGMCAGG